MNWNVCYLPEAEKDFADLDGSQKIIVRKAIQKVRSNPLPVEEGGYGKPLGNKRGTNLTGFLKIKILSEGIRVVYKLVRSEGNMLIVVIGLREDDEVYALADQRADHYNL